MQVGYPRALRGAAKKWAIGCVIPASWPLLAAGARFTQPRDRSLADPCIWCTYLSYHFSCDVVLVAPNLGVGRSVLVNCARQLFDVGCAQAFQVFYDDLGILEQHINHLHL